MINDCMKSNKMLGMIQPKNSANQDNAPKLHGVGCLGKYVLGKQKMEDF